MSFGAEVLITAAIVSVAGLLVAVSLPMTGWAENSRPHWAVRAGRWLARAWTGQLSTARVARGRRDRRWAIRAVQQRAASEHASQTREVWLREVAEQHRMEADR